MNDTSNSIWDHLSNLDFNLELEPDDPRTVTLDDVRGQYLSSDLYRQLQYKSDVQQLMGPPPKSKYLLFGGHRGCGKSTELRRIARELARPEAYYVVSIDVLKELDVNNLEYSDLLLAQAKGLIDRLIKDGLSIEQVFLSNLERWFDERVEKHAATHSFATELKASAQVKSGLPWLATLMAGLTGSVKGGSTYRDEVRRVVKNSFSEFAKAFNLLLDEAIAQIISQGRGRQLLFIVDGTDRLSGEDAKRFFIDDVFQLKSIRSVCIYCAPIDLLQDEGLTAQNFDKVVRLPMIKLAEKGLDATVIEKAWDRLAMLIDRRMPSRFFDSPETVRYLIEHSGGHPRDLLRLVRYAFDSTDEEIISRPAAERAVKLMAVEFQRQLSSDDFNLLKKIDCSPPNYTPVSVETQRLLKRLALLEYNSFWWQSHPLVRTLEGYGHADG